MPCQITVLYMIAFPQKLIDIKDLLIREELLLSTPLNDGRINSSVNESEILKVITTKFDINEPNSREWFDFSFEEKEVFYPVNIKVTTTLTPDNLNCKLGIYYCLTGLLPDFSNGINWLSYFEKLHNNLGKHKNKDYYFLIVNKDNPKDIFVNSLKHIPQLQANGNNLPFQCRWNDNREAKKRTFDESKQFILSKFGESIKLRAEIYFNFKKYFQEYV